MARTPGPAASAPDLVGPTSFLDWPVQGARRTRVQRRRTFAHVRLEVDLQPELERAPALRVFERLESLLREREIVEGEDLLRLTARVLHGFASVGFSRVDHWEVEPGGWLPLPEPTHARLEEPLGHLVRALADKHWQGLTARRSFSVRLSGKPPFRADLTVRRLHRERRHTLTIDLHGRFTERDVRGVLAALGRQVPVLRGSVQSFSYA
jgi:hypothetical protein